MRRAGPRGLGREPSARYRGETTSGMYPGADRGGISGQPRRTLRRCLLGQVDPKGANRISTRARLKAEAAGARTLLARISEAELHAADPSLADAADARRGFLARGDAEAADAAGHAAPEEAPRRPRAA